MPMEIERLEQRKETGITIDPDSNKARALAFLAADEHQGYTPSEIATRTDIATGSAPKTMQRLREQGLVISIDGYYFIPGDKLPKVRRVLTDAHADKHLSEHSDVEWDSSDGDTTEEAEAIVDEVINEKDYHDAA